MSLNKNWDLEVRPKVYKKLKKFPTDDQKHILEVIEMLPIDPYFGDIEKMEGQENSWRRRMGSYRIFYEVLVSRRNVIVFRIDRRTSKTY